MIMIVCSKEGRCVVILGDLTGVVGIDVMGLLFVRSGSFWGDRRGMFLVR